MVCPGSPCQRALKKIHSVLGSELSNLDNDATAHTLVG